MSDSVPISRTLKLRYILTIHRLVYHHHIDTRNEEETISEVNRKQKKCSANGDWVNQFQEDFKFMCERMNDDTIKNISKNVQKVWVKKKVEEAAFKS